MDIKALGDQIVSTVKEFVARRLEDVTTRLDEVVARLDSLPVPKDGQPGKDADMEALAVVIDERVKEQSSAVRESLLGVVAEQINRMHEAVEAVKNIAPPQFDKPKDGEPGRDALDLDVMLSIDEERRYRRGCYATHKGGLWKTIRTSEGMDGWECIVDGVDAVEIEMSGDREITIKTRMSSGREVSKSFSVPVVLDRGVFKDGTAYKAGDGVTWAGSFWIAQRDTSEKPDMADSGFRLAVKRGRDGKEAMPIKPKAATMKIDGAKGVA